MDRTKPEGISKDFKGYFSRHPEHGGKKTFVNKPSKKKALENKKNQSSETGRKKHFAKQSDKKERQGMEQMLDHWE